MVNDAPRHAGQHAVDDHRPGNDEHLRAHARDKALVTEFDGGRHDGVGKARDGHQCARTGLGGQLLVPAQRRGDGGQRDQRRARQRGGVRQRQARRRVQRAQPLAEQADRAAHTERPRAVLREGRGRRGVLAHLIVLFWIGFHTSRSFFGNSAARLLTRPFSHCSPRALEICAVKEKCRTLKKPIGTEKPMGFLMKIILGAVWELDVLIFFK